MGFCFSEDRFKNRLSKENTETDIYLFFSIQKAFSNATRTILADGFTCLGKDIWL
jgi:hypothetical protein